MRAQRRPSFLLPARVDAGLAGLASVLAACHAFGMGSWRDHITVDPTVCHGQACITNTRVLVTAILDNVAAGLSPEEIAASYPTVTRESIQAAVRYAAELAKERSLPLAK